MPSVREYCNTQPTLAGAGYGLLLMGMVMRDKKIDCIVIVDDRKAAEPRPIGILSDREIVGSWLGLPNKKIHHIRMDQVMATPHLVKASDEPAATLATMRENDIRFAPVVSDEGTLVGLLSRDALEASASLGSA